MAMTASSLNSDTLRQPDRMLLERGAAVGRDRLLQEVALLEELLEADRLRPRGRQALEFYDPVQARRSFR